MSEFWITIVFNVVVSVSLAALLIWLYLAHKRHKQTGYRRPNGERPIFDLGNPTTVGHSTVGH